MTKAVWISCAVAAAAAALSFGPRVTADGDVDWGVQVQRELNSAPNSCSESARR